uniref:UDP-glycosyltransferases domain-containing protein n=1 Tax=Kalanchoe fedtschenkoi TaxID=63787 RepID=A0A7N0V6V0_KALFE
MLPLFLPLAERITLGERLKMSGTQCDMIAFRTFRELEGYYLDYIQQEVQRPVFPVGHTLLPPPATPLVEKMQIWLGRFEPKSVVYCSFGSECTLPLDQLQEILLGLELTGFPFLVALRPPEEADCIESALPEGFKTRTQERGWVTGEWVQQQHILGHESVGCFITHCGASSAAEGLMSECQLVLLPYLITDRFVSAKVMSQDMRVGVEVERGDEDGLFDRYGVCKAVMQVMNNVEDGVGKEVKINHDKLRRVLLSPELESSWYQEFETKLKQRLSMM